MKRVCAIAAALGIGAILVPVAWSASDPAQATDQAPVAALRVEPAAVTAGDEVLLDGSGSKDDGGVVGYAWDLDGDGTFERVAGAEPTLRQTLAEPGSVRIGLRVVDASGQTADAYETVAVAEAKEKRLAATEPVAPAPASEQRTRGASSDERYAAEPKHEQAAATAPRTPRVARATAPTVHAAASATVSISDFKFAPKSVTVHVGDTVTWSNAGPTAHTATADGGSFDTGLLSKGASGSFTFKKAGTFSYHCQPHPFMKATVVVTGGSGGGVSGSGSSDGTGGSGSSGDSSGSSSGSGSSDSSLPQTGLAIGSFFLVGALLLVSGLTLRRRVRDD